MRKLLFGLAAALALLPGRAAATCINTTGPVVLQKIRLGDPGNVWVGCVNNSLDLLSNNVVLSNSSTTITASWTWYGSTVTITGQDPSGFSLKTSSGVNVGGTVNASLYDVGGVSGMTKTCGGGNYLDGQVVNGGIVTGGQCLTIPAAGTTPQPAAQGINYLLSASSGIPLGVVVSTGPGTFQICPGGCQAVFRGALYSIPMTVIASTYTIQEFTWNPNDGIRDWPLVDLEPPSISSNITAGRITDDLILAISTTSNAGNSAYRESIKRTVWALPVAGVQMATAGASATNPSFPTSPAVAPIYNCPSGQSSVDSCISNQVQSMVTDPGYLEFFVIYSGQSPNTIYSFVVNNTSGGSQNAIAYRSSGGNMSYWISIDGATGTAVSTDNANTNISIGSGYHLVTLYMRPTAASNLHAAFTLPPQTTIVRGGFW